MKTILIRLAAFLFALTPVFVRAGGDEVVVVYNSRLPESKAVAEHYAKMREVPAHQVFGFELSASEEISRGEFHDALQMPLAKKLEESGLWKFGDSVYPHQRTAGVVASRRGVQNPLRRALLRRAGENRAGREPARKWRTRTSSRNCCATKPPWTRNSPGCRWPRTKCGWPARWTIRFTPRRTEPC